jgi:purine-nucleoside phosphorylase
MGEIMATPHNEAKSGDIAETVLLPGDPLRARFIAENFLEGAVCYNTVRNMLGFTGSYKGKRLSVQGTGMGIPSISIYATELAQVYGAKTLIRIGTCGSYRADLPVRSLVMAAGACTDSGINRLRFQGKDYAPIADFELMLKAKAAADSLGLALRVGNVFSSDNFYGDDPEAWKRWAAYGVLAVEMEAAGLYTLAAKLGCRALALLTVSDSIVSHEETSAEERQESFTDMMKVALEAATA